MTDAAPAPREPQVVNPQRVPQRPRKCLTVNPADDARPLTIGDDRDSYGE